MPHTKTISFRMLTHIFYEFQTNDSKPYTMTRYVATYPVNSVLCIKLRHVLDNISPHTFRLLNDAEILPEFSQTTLIKLISRL